MTTILPQKDEDTILVNEINSKHIVVAIDESNYPVILGNSDCGADDYKFLCLSDGFSMGNCYIPFNSIQSCIENYIKRGWRLQVFHQDDWKKALQWLIDNA